jgi:excisionase family DNA binding protein
MSNPVITLQNVIDKIDVLTNAVLSNKQALNLSEASMLTGLSESYLYKLTSAQQIPHYKPRGKCIYFNRSELESWLLTGRVKTNVEIEANAVNVVLRGA